MAGAFIPLSFQKRCNGGGGARGANAHPKVSIFGENPGKTRGNPGKSKNGTHLALI